MLTQPRDPNNKTKPAYKKLALTVTHLSIPSQLVLRYEEMTKTNEKLFLDQNPLKSKSNSTFVFLPMLEEKRHDTQ